MLCGTEMIARLSDAMFTVIKPFNPRFTGLQIKRAYTSLSTSSKNAYTTFYVPLHCQDVEADCLDVLIIFSMGI